MKTLISVEERRPDQVEARYVDYKRLSQWLVERGHLAGQSAAEWESFLPGGRQSDYRNGMCCAFREVETILGQFVVRDRNPGAAVVLGFGI